MRSFFAVTMFLIFALMSTMAVAQGLPWIDPSNPIIEPPSGEGSGGSPGRPEPIVDWEKKQDMYQRLEGLGTNLMGDGIDPHTGGIVFEHTDVSLPGNSGLDVSIRRRMSQGKLYHNSVSAEFGDWEIIVPRIKVITSAESNWRVGNRCTSANGLQDIDVIFSIPGIGEQSGDEVSNYWVTTSGVVRTRAYEYSNGISLDTPEAGNLTLLRNASSANVYGVAGATYATKEGWKVSCLNNVNGGGQGFQATAPNGNIYKFDNFYELRAKDLGFMSSYAPETTRKRYKSIVAATEVTDVNGNWVRYAYDSDNRLTGITSNDGRSITVEYTGASKLIARVIANGRTWSYSYGVNAYVYNYWGNFSEAIAGGNPALTSVTQPDGKSWSFSLDAMVADPPPHFRCLAGISTLSMTHPYGTSAQFTLTANYHRPSLDAEEYRPTNDLIPIECPALESYGTTGIGFAAPATVQYLKTIPTISVIEKRLTSSSMPDMVWAYQYEQDNGAVGSSSSDRTNWTTRTNPDGSVVKYYHAWMVEPNGGKLIKKEISDGSTLLQSETNTFAVEERVGSSPAHPGWFTSDPGYARRLIKTVIEQDGDTWTSENVYNLNPNLSDYSFGHPVQTQTYSNISTTPRVTDATYEHNTTKWILGLPLSVTTNGRNMASYVYDGFGQKTSQTKYGAAYATFGYNGDGTIVWFKDANLRQTSLSGWKRGTPQDITRADNVALHQYVDDNGWLTSTVDANSNTISYGRDNMGRLTLFTPPAGRAPTTIGYSFGANTVQTITSGQSQSIITYDSMWRPTLVEGKDLSTASSSFINTEYDGAGRAIFTSFPSNSSTSTAGTDTIYDALGRVLTATETVTPFASISTAYLSGHKTQTTDADGNQTTHTKNGFGELTQILQPLGVTTDMAVNIWGEMLSLRQHGTQNGVTSDQTHTYEYNPQDQYRLCRHHTPESGDTLMKYDPAGQMTSQARGQASGNGCATPSGTALVDLGYDLVGRPTATTYNDGTTPNITRDYDNNGNVMSVYRGAGTNTVDWGYAYDNHNALISEALSIDGKTYASDYGYNTSGHMVSRTLPSGRVLDLTNDGLGRLTSIAGDVFVPGNSNGIDGGDLSQGDSVFADSTGFNATNYSQGIELVDGADAFVIETDGYSSAGGTYLMASSNRVNGGDLDSGVFYTVAAGEVISVSFEAKRLIGLDSSYAEMQINYLDVNNATLALSRFQVRDAIDWKLGSSTSTAPAGTVKALIVVTIFGRGIETTAVGITKFALRDFRMVRGTSTGGGSGGSGGTTVPAVLDYMTFASGMSYHASGPLSAMTYGNGQVFSQTLNARLQPSHVQSSFNSNVALDMTYSYDVRGKVSNVINGAITGDDRTYGYDALGRLTSSTGSWGSGSYIYDALGNIRSYSEGSRALAMTYDNDNKLTSHTDSVGGGRSLTYDARGNVTALGGLGFTYDMSDQPTAISGSASGTYTYDGNLKRVKSVVDGKTIYNVYDASGTLIHIDQVTDDKATDYVGKIARITTSGGIDTITYLHADQLGSANTGTDADGNVAWREQYTPFGRTLTSLLVNNDQAGFTGHIKDGATGLNYMQARYYDPVLIRFLSTDPIGFSAQRPETFSKYAYVNNDPINATDPSGRSAVTKFVKQTIKHKGNVFEAAFDVGGEMVTVFAPHSTPFDRIIAAVELVSPISASDVKDAKKILNATKKKFAGRKGGIDTRAQNNAIGDKINSNGGQTTDGFGQREKRFAGSDGGNKGSRYSDGSAVDANGNSFEVQTVDTTASGALTSRERAAAIDIAGHKKGNIVVCVSKKPCN